MPIRSAMSLRLIASTTYTCTAYKDGSLAFIVILPIVKGSRGALVLIDCSNSEIGDEPELGLGGFTVRFDADGMAAA